MIIAYFTEQMAHLMQRQSETLDVFRKIGWEQYMREAERRKTTELALELMLHKDEVLRVFNGRSRISLSQFQVALYRRLHSVYLDTLREAIPLTDYLVLEAAGNGFRVWRATDYAAARGSGVGQIA